MGPKPELQKNKLEQNWKLKSKFFINNASKNKIEMGPVYINLSQLLKGRVSTTFLHNFKGPRFYVTHKSPD